MTRNAPKASFLIGILFAVCTLSCCVDPDAVKNDDYLIRLGDSVITVLEFNRAFEIAKAAYPYSEMQDPDAAKKAKLMLLNQMSEEMVIQARAKDRGISISDAELETAISEIKKDYPEDVFEQMLLEYAVPYDAWEKRVKIRLLMKKVIADEIEGQIVVTPDDITKYYQENDIDIESASSPEEDSQEVNTNIVKYLRRKKEEAVYQTWIKSIRETYTIEINRTAWKEIADE